MTSLLIVVNVRKCGCSGNRTLDLIVLRQQGRPLCNATVTDEFNIMRNDLRNTLGGSLDF
jgi:hypothetical protein